MTFIETLPENKHRMNTSQLIYKDSITLIPTVEKDITRKPLCSQEHRHSNQKNVSANRTNNI